VSSGGFGKARSHSSAISACRLNETQNAGPKLDAKSSSPVTWLQFLSRVHVMSAPRRFPPEIPLADT
jgi:hypothetical protein